MVTIYHLCNFGRGICLKLDYSIHLILAVVDILFSEALLFCAILLMGILRNICVKLFLKSGTSFKDLLYV